MMTRIERELISEQYFGLLFSSNLLFLSFNRGANDLTPMLRKEVKLRFTMIPVETVMNTLN